MRRLRWGILLSGVLLLILCPALPVLGSPYLSSQYYCLVDGDSLQPIYGKNADVPRQAASTTKMMTAILAIEYADTSEKAVVSRKADRTPEYTIGLREGQTISIHELLKALLIRSSNDAAVVLAEHIAGDEGLFSWLMSKKAFAIGAMSTVYKNSSGLPDAGHYSTAYDLARIGRYAMSKPEIQSLVSKAQVEFQHPGYLQPMTLRNTNKLIDSYPGADGIKTGTANEAGKCLVGSASHGNRKLVAVVLKSGNRTGDCMALFNYGFKQCQRHKILDEKESIKSIRLSGAERKWVDVTPSRSVWIWQGDQALNIEKKITVNYQLQAPIQKGQPVGYLDLYINNSLYDTVPLISSESIDKEPGLIGKSLRILLNSGKE